MSLLRNIFSTIKDYGGRIAGVTALNELLTAERTDMINVQFQYNINNNDTNYTQTGTAVNTISHANQKAQIHTGVGVGRTIISSRDSIRYVTGHEVFSETTVIFAAPQINTKQKIGIGDDIDGFAGLGYNGLTFGVWLRTVDDGELFVPQSSFNGDKIDGTGKSKYNINPQDFNICRVRYAWFGILPIIIEIGSGDEWIEVHRYSKINNTTNTHLGNPTLPISAIIERTSGAGVDMVLQTASWRGGIAGRIPEGTLIDRKKVIKTVKTVNGTNVPVYSIRSLTTFQGRRNHVKSRVGTVTISTDGTKAVEFDIFVTGTLTGGVWVPLEPDTSVLEYNNTATAFAPTSSIRGGTVLGKIDRDRINLVQGDVVVPIYAGEELHFVATTSASNSIVVYFRTIEEF